MKVRIELTESDSEDEIIIKCKQIDETIQKLQKYIADISSQSAAIAFFKENQEYYISLDKIIFFETEADIVYAHTADDAYKVKFRLYELEDILTKDFIRISKSTILNTSFVYSIERNLTSASLVKFYNSHKQVFVSRKYYSNLKQRLDERRNYEN